MIWLLSRIVVWPIKAATGTAKVTTKAGAKTAAGSFKAGYRTGHLLGRAELPSGEGITPFGVARVPIAIAASMSSPLATIAGYRVCRVVPVHGELNPGRGAANPAAGGEGVRVPALCH